jgi:acetyl-CoA synthetase/medium-chain acyl-CoA synthetase
MVVDERIRNRNDYERLRASFRWDSPELFNFGTDVVDRWARTSPNRTAIRWVGPDEERQVSFAQISARSNQLAQAVARLGIKQGDRVLVILPRVLPWWETLVGLMKGGVVAIPGTTLLTPADIAYRVRRADVTAVITDEAGAENVDRMPGPTPQHKILVSGESREGWISYEEIVDAAPPDPPAVQTRGDEPALIYFTSGTTGLPKMVLHTQASYGVGHQTTGRFWLDLRPTDLHWNISDTGWAKAAWSSLFAPWICGSALFVRHTTGRFDPQDVLDCLSKYPITGICAAPTIYRMLVQQDLSGLRPKALNHCVAAGEPLDPTTIQVWKSATGLTIRGGYGQTETVLLCANFPGVEVKPGSMGLPAPGIELAVIDGDGNRLPPGVVGELAVRVRPHRPLGMFTGYWHDEQATAQCYRDGWYITGDCGRIDEDGYFWFVGRADDIILSSAYRIGPFEVESALVKHPAVAEAAVVGKPDPVRGAIVKAFVVLAGGYHGSDTLTAELQDHTKQATAPYKYPREIEFVDELPKTVSGKIRRVELRKAA